MTSRNIDARPAVLDDQPSGSLPPLEAPAEPEELLFVCVASAMHSQSISHPDAVATAHWLLRSLPKKRVSIRFDLNHEAQYG